MGGRGSKKFIFLKMSTIWLQLTEISLKFESSSQKLFDFNRLKIVVYKGVYVLVIPIFFERENLSSTDNYAGDCTVVEKFILI